MPARQSNCLNTLRQGETEHLTFFRLVSILKTNVSFFFHPGIRAESGRSSILDGGGRQSDAGGGRRAVRCRQSVFPIRGAARSRPRRPPLRLAREGEGGGRADAPRRQRWCTTNCRRTRTRQPTVGSGEYHCV